MATVRPDISQRNKYWIDKHRYYELKHFCMQYPRWKRLYSGVEILSACQYSDLYSRTSISDPTARIAEERLTYRDRIKLIEKVAMEADPELANYILKGVTEELSYNNLKSRLEIPCGRDMYYDRYRKFFWLLDKERD